MKIATIIAMLCITALTTLALLKGFDGMILAGAFGALGSLAGVSIGKAT